MEARRTRPADLLFVALIALMVGLTLLVWLDPGIAPAVVNEPLDLVLNAGASLVAIAVAILAWIRFREEGAPSALFRGSAFLVLAAQNLFFIGISVADGGEALGLDLASPGQLPLWSVIVGRSLAAALLLVAGVAAARDESRVGSVPATVALVAPTLAFAVLSWVMAAFAGKLPQLLGPSALSQLRANPTAPLLGAGGPEIIILQGAIGVAFLAAALLAYRAHRRADYEAELYLSIGFVLAAFSQVHSAIHPGSYASLVTTGDLLRVTFYAVMLIALAVQARADIRALRRANAALVQLREVEVERATVEERARLAREIHDGMSQELWYAKLKQARLVSLDTLPAPARELADDVGRAIESALAEARQAIMALRPTSGGSFAQVVARFVEEFGDRFGILAEAETDDVADRLPARHQAELLRILQEALTNTHRHADATRVGVRLEASTGGARMTVTDNGRGFDAEARRGSGYGLSGMRERATLMGAELSIESAIHDGTRVIVEIPLEKDR